jgi:glycosyltransferase involved in cell wall biosynthesis
MLVWNEFLHDARVTKEAETLVNAGYAVTVLALHVPEKNLLRETHSSGFEIVRVSRPILFFFRGIKARLLSKNRSSSAKTKTVNSNSSASNSFFSTQIRPLIEPFSRFLTHLRLIYTAVSLKADIYHAHDFNVLLTTWIAAKIRSAPLVYDAHEISSDREGYQNSRWLIHHLEKWLVHQVDFMLTTTDARASFFQETYNIPKPLVLQNRPRFQIIEPNHSLRHSLGLEKPFPIVLYQGGIQPGRGLRNLIQAATQVEEAYFVLMGWGRQEAEIRDLIEKNQLRDRAFIHPAVPLEQLLTYTASADIGIQILRNTCLNHYTTDSNKLFEYLMAGLPVVASDFPEIRKIVHQYQVGFCVDPENIDEIAAKINQFLTQKDLYQAYKGNALKAAQFLNWEAQEVELINAYSQLNHF